jgi:hypothetical protein
MRIQRAKGWNVVQSSVLALVSIATLLAIACGSESNSVASLEGTDSTIQVKESSVTDVENAWLNLAQCLRDEGIAVSDPVVNSKGIVEKPGYEDGAQASKEELTKGYEVCEKHIEGLTFEKETVDKSESVDRLLELAVCLRDQGIDVDDPDMSSDNPGDEIGALLKKDWNSPAMQEIREVCDVNAAFGVGK